MVHSKTHPHRVFSQSTKIQICMFIEPVQMQKEGKSAIFCFKLSIFSSLGLLSLTEMGVRWPNDCCLQL